MHHKSRVDLIFAIVVAFVSLASAAEARSHCNSGLKGSHCGASSTAQSRHHALHQRAKASGSDRAASHLNKGAPPAQARLKSVDAESRFTLVAFHSAAGSDGTASSGALADTASAGDRSDAAVKTPRAVTHVRARRYMRARKHRAATHRPEASDSKLELAEISSATSADEAGPIAETPLPKALPSQQEIQIRKGNPNQQEIPTAAPNEPAAQEKMREEANEWNPTDVWNGGATRLEKIKPSGFAGQTPAALAPPSWTRDSDFIPIQDRWRIGFPTWNRYKAGTPGEYPYTLGHWWDPYDQNVLKGDYPLLGQHTFFSFTGLSDTIAEDHRLPTAAPQSSVPSNNPDFFGAGNRVDLQQNFIMSFDLFHGDAGFKPVDWEFRFTPVFNLNYLDAQETGVRDINTSKGTTRFDSHVGIQELSFQYKLADLSEYYDVVDAKAGIQPFTSDFRGFIYSDEEPGFRIFGNYDNNKYEYNLAYFEQLDKDTNSGLNTVFRTRGQHVILSNLTQQDFIFPGYDAQLDFDYNNDNGGTHYDNNGFLVRPAFVGSIKRHAVNTAYFGWTGDGHIGRINVTNAFYEAIGRDSFNPIAGKAVNINAQMGALELAYERDWMTYKADFFYASGDGNINSHTASGFDSIFDNEDFGAPFGYWNRQGIGLSGTGVLLKSPLSLLPDLRTSKGQGQANFVNPGILFYNLGLIAKLTPQLTVESDVNFSQFDKVGMLEQLLHQNALGHDLGIDTSIGVRYRPLLIENIILTGGVALFSPASGFKDIYSSKELYSFFTSMTFTY